LLRVVHKNELVDEMSMVVPLATRSWNVVHRHCNEWTKRLTPAEIEAKYTCIMFDHEVKLKPQLRRFIISCVDEPHFILTYAITREPLWMITLAVIMRLNLNL